jgi:hypothetical protein
MKMTIDPTVMRFMRVSSNRSGESMCDGAWCECSTPGERKIARQGHFAACLENELFGTL